MSNDRTFDDVYTGTFQWQFLPWCNGLIGAVAETFLAVRAASVRLPSCRFRLASLQLGTDTTNHRTQFFTNRMTKNFFYAWMASLVTLVVFGSTMTFAMGILVRTLSR